MYPCASSTDGCAAAPGPNPLLPVIAQSPLVTCAISLPLKS